MRTRREIEIEEKVQDLLERHDIRSAPVPVETLARKQGLRVIESYFEGEVSGALIIEKGHAGIAVNSKHHSNRKRFTIAHELAHFLLEHMGEGDHIDWEFTVLRRDIKSSDASDTKEIEANRFAANLLMPKNFLLRDLGRFLNFQGEAEIDDAAISVLARKYQVSETAMKYRLVNLGIMSPA